MNVFYATLALMVLSFQSCKNNDDSEVVDVKSIEGTWKLVGQDFGLPEGYVKVDDGAEIVFNEDSTFEKGKGECNKGKFSKTEDDIIFDYVCAGKFGMLSGGIQRESYAYVNNRLRLTPTYLDCPEGCYYDYEKVSDN